MSIYPRSSALVDTKNLEAVVESLYNEIDRLNQLLEKHLYDYAQLANEYSSFRAEILHHHPDLFI